MIEVREARFSDVPKIIPMAKEFFNESKFHETFGFTADEDETMKSLAWVVGSRDRKMFIAENSKGPVGFLIVGVLPWFCNSRELLAYEMYFYVDKPHRRGKISRQLVAAYEEWAKSLGAKAIEFGCTDELRGKSMQKFLTRLGYVPALRSHVKKVEA